MIPLILRHTATTGCGCCIIKKKGCSAAYVFYIQAYPLRIRCPIVAIENWVQFSANITTRAPYPAHHGKRANRRQACSLQVIFICCVDNN
jgi:hypothetical protein